MTHRKRKRSDIYLGKMYRARQKCPKITLWVPISRPLEAGRGYYWGCGIWVQQAFNPCQWFMKTQKWMPHICCGSLRQHVKTNLFFLKPTRELEVACVPVSLTFSMLRQRLAWSMNALRAQPCDDAKKARNQDLKTVPKGGLLKAITTMLYCSRKK